MRPILRSFTLALLFTLAACGTLEMQIERDPALDDGTATQTMVLPQTTLNDPVQPGNNIEDSGELGMVYF